MFLGLLFALVVPLALGLVVLLRRSVAIQLVTLGISLLAVIGSTIVLELVPNRGPVIGSSWEGYAVIVLLPFSLAGAAMFGAHELRTRLVNLPAWPAAAAIAIAYWFGLVAGLSIAVTLGWANP
jgi:hypothetical protein